MWHLLMISMAAMASDNSWLCTDEASQVHGDMIYACGTGTGQDENAARQAAFMNAKAEFKMICDGSDSCLHHEVTITPKRMSCEDTHHNDLYRQGNRWKCYRLLVFEIGKEISKRFHNVAESSNEEPKSSVQIMREFIAATHPKTY